MSAGDVEAVLERALGAGEEGDFEGMAEQLRDALEDHPEEPGVLCFLGIAERELGLTGVAYERFKACLRLHPADPYVLATAGNALAAFDDADAEPALRTAAMTAPELPLARWLYGAYLSREGMVEEALAELDAAVELAPEESAPWLERGVAHALAGDWSRAADDLDRAAALEGEEGWARVLTGLALLELERPEDAMADLVAGARERPEDIEAQLLAALAAAAVEEDALAWEMLERSRQVAGPGDLPEVAAVEERLEVGPGPSLLFLRGTLGPRALHDRLMERP